MVVELGFRDGMTPPPDLPTGECICWPTGNGGQFHIHRADPRILISGELVRLWHNGGSDGGVPMVELRCTVQRHPRDGGPQLHDPIGDVVTVHGVNRTVIYRITGYEPSVHGYIGEWPD